MSLRTRERVERVCHVSANQFLIHDELDISYNHTITQSHNHTITQSHNHTIAPLHNHTMTESYNHTITQ